MPFITVFTPTFNRAHCLSKGYEALQRQTCKDFLWMVIDDGSTDDTRQLIEDWGKNDNGFEIKYFYKENGGLYTGYNKAIQEADSELCVCVDSDDYLTDDAIELVKNFWEQYRDKDYAGIVALDCFEDGTIIGDRLPEKESVNLIDLLIGTYHILNGDRKNFVRTDLYKKFAPMKEFPGEKDYSPHILHLKISQERDFLVLNHPVCVVEYQEDGMTNTVYKQYLRSPNSFRDMRLFDMSLKQASIRFKLKKHIHYVSSCLISRKPCLKDSPDKLLTIIAFPFGIIFTLYLVVYDKVHRGYNKT